MAKLLVVVVFLFSSFALLAQNNPNLDPMHTTQPVCDAEINDGIDIASPVGTPVNASADGVVVKVWNDDKNGCGLSLLVRHADGSVTGFAYLSAFYVKVGDVVTTGQKIALSGQSGNAKSPTLHWTMADSNGQKINPLRAIKSQPANRTDPTEFRTAEQIKRALEQANGEKDTILKDQIESHVFESWKRNRYIAEAEYCDNLDRATDIWYANNGDYRKIPPALWDKLREIDKYQFKHALPGKEVLSTARKVEHP